MRSFCLAGLSLLTLTSLLAATVSAGEEPKAPQPRVQQLVQAAGQAAVVVNQPRGGGYYVPEKVDPADKTCRVLLLLPGGPILIELALTIDGRPFQSFREAQIDEALASADADGDGQVTWEEALAKPGFAGGRLAYLGQNDEARKRSLAQFDRNKDGIVDRYELRSLLAQFSGGPALMVQATGFGQINPPLRELLDVDQDGVISAAEIAGAEARLKSRDANDNDILDLAELTGSAAGGYRVVAGGGGFVRQSPLVHHLQENTDWAALHGALTEKYAGKESLTAEKMPLAPDLVERLDGNGNKTLEADELSALLVADPHLVYEVNFGESGELPAGGTLKAARGTFSSAQTAASPDTITLEVPGARLQLAAHNPRPTLGNADNYVRQIFNNYDKDKNGYLEKEELGAQMQLAQQFAAWDLDGDGKVYPEELKKFYEKTQLPNWQRIVVSAGDQGNSLFSLLDVDGNGRLSLREMRGAPERLKSADKNGDGQITLDEIPSTIRLNAARGAYYGGQFAQGGGGLGGLGGGGARPAGPEWFIRMDRNGDGDITPREFLGDEEQFKRLDANGDGFIDLKEAEAAR